jgi:DNA-binding response OmpR family regulator
MSLRATALIVGPTDGPGAALADLSRSLGLTSTIPYTSVAAAEARAQQTPLLFFLFAAAEDVSTLKPVADAIRFAPSRRIRFSPLVYFAESPSVEAIRACTEMGFDDVITLPFTQRRVTDRLKRLVDHMQVYHETASYLGPDRGRAGSAERQFRRLEIIRTAVGGVNVMRDEMQAH